jgi:hypothetical protein
MRPGGDLEAQSLIEGVRSTKRGLEVAERAGRISPLENRREKSRAYALALEARLDTDEHEVPVRLRRVE